MIDHFNFGHPKTNWGRRSLTFSYHLRLDYKNDFINNNLELFFLITQQTEYLKYIILTKLQK